MTEMAPEPSPRISVSREALRAELAEMELRLRIWISAELEEKASAAELESLRGEFNAKVAWAEGLMPLRDQYISQLNKVTVWRDQAMAGHFTEAQEAVMRTTAKYVLAERENEGWTRRERLFAIIAVGATGIVTVLNLLEASGVLGK